MDFTNIHKLAEDAEQEVSRICSDLVKINSAHPLGHTDQVVDYIKQFCDEHVIDCEVHAGIPPHVSVSWVPPCQRASRIPYSAAAAGSDTDKCSDTTWTSRHIGSTISAFMNVQSLFEPLF